MRHCLDMHLLPRNPRFRLRAGGRWPLFWLLAGAVALAGAGNLRAQLPGDIFGRDEPETATVADPVEVTTIWSHEEARPGDRVILGVVFDIAEGFHINPDAAQVEKVGDFEPWATDVRILRADDGLTLEAPRYPKPHAVEVEYAEGKLLSYEGRTVVYVPVKVGERVEPGTTATVVLEAEYQTCDARQCLAPETTDPPLEATLEIVPPGTEVEAVHPELVEEAAKLASAPRGDAVLFDLFGWSYSIDASSWLGLLLLLLVAALGGALLNFTPCVLPVIPIKIIGLSQAAGNRRRCFLLGLSMSLGVVAFWLGLGVLIASIADFTATNQLFQYPAFTITVGVIIALMAIGMCGLFAIRLPDFVHRIQPSHDTIPGSFGFGIMTAILSTPCTAPFMGAAAAWAATQHPGTTLATFSAIGAGMALPYLILSAAPGLVRKMPRSGPASELIKQTMGLLMLAAAAYFVGVGLSALLVTPPDPPSLAYWWAVMFFSAAAGVWLAYRTVVITSSPARRAVFVGLGVVLVLLSVGGAARLTDEGPIDWVYYTPERFDSALAGGSVVVADFTAEWCLNCKALEQTVLHSESVVELFADGEVVPMKVDLTGNNPVAKAKLKETGRLTIPLLVIYSADGKEVFKSDFYTVDQVIQAVRRARAGAS